MTVLTRIVIVVILALWSHSLAASDVTVPVHVQLPLLKNIWKLDRTFPERAQVTIAIIYQESHGPSATIKTQVMSWRDTNGNHPNCIAVAIDQKGGMDLLRTVQADVFYVAPLRAADIAAIAAIARERRIRTNSAVPQYVESGLAVSIDVRDDRPLIVINVAAAKAEGASFPAQLLHLAKLVGGAR
jgi:hypothetical protein